MSIIIVLIAAVHWPVQNSNPQVQGSRCLSPKVLLLLTAQCSLRHPLKHLKLILVVYFEVKEIIIISFSHFAGPVMWSLGFPTACKQNVLVLKSWTGMNWMQLRIHHKWGKVVQELMNFEMRTMALKFLLLHSILLNMSSQTTIVCSTEQHTTNRQWNICNIINIDDKEQGFYIILILGGPQMILVKYQTLSHLYKHTVLAY